MSESPSNQAIWDELGQIINTFSLLECDKCAIAMTQWLEQKNIPYKILRLKTKRRSDFYIISARVSTHESITENGIHYGVEIFGKVFGSCFRHVVFRLNQYSVSHASEV
jgi:hypothetical protein